MFRFAHPEYLFLLAIIPLLLAVFIFYERKRKKMLRRFGNADLLAQLMPNVSFRRPYTKTILVLTALLFVVLVLAQPQFGSTTEPKKRKGIEVMIALDVSNSMLAQDIQPNRLEKAKQIISKLVDNMTNDRVGMVVFAGDAYVQLPITADYVSAKMFLSSISPALVPRQGTTIGSAIDMCLKSFGENKNDAGRTIIILTDGENHEDDAVGAAKLAASNGVVINVIGIGTAAGVPVPVQGTMSFRKDREGNVVVSKLNEKMCEDIALAGKGVYVKADNSNLAQKVVADQLEKISQGEIEYEASAGYNEQFQSFALLALLILLVETYVFDRKNKRLSKIRIFDLKEKIKNNL